VPDFYVREWRRLKMLTLPVTSAIDETKSNPFNHLPKMRFQSEHTTTDSAFPRHSSLLFFSVFFIVSHFVSSLHTKTHTTSLPVNTNSTYGTLHFRRC
ncbi:unnamed protein product, partial [Amoebophrya sp. A25]